jgi:hypothetical protein
MPSDPRLESALDLARKAASLKAAEDWLLENLQAAEDGGEETPGRAYYLTLTFRWVEAAPENEEELRREII